MGARDRRARETPRGGHQIDEKERHSSRRRLPESDGQADLQIARRPDRTQAEKVGQLQRVPDLHRGLPRREVQEGHCDHFSSKNGTLTTYIDGRKKNSVKSKALNESLMNLYLGEETVTKDVRQDTLSALAGF